MIGLPLFLLIGSPHLPLARRQQQLAINARIREASEGSIPAPPDPTPALVHLVGRAEPQPRRPAAHRRHAARLHPDYLASIAEMTCAVRESAL
ncbi:MAG: hypothetical protein R2703_05130 [Micropruina glycogenica]